MGRPLQMARRVLRLTALDSMSLGLPSFCLLICFWAVIVAIRADGTTAGPPRQDRSDELFSPIRVLSLKIELSSEAAAALKTDSRNDMRATLLENNAVYRDVGVRLKGHYGSRTGNLYEGSNNDVNDRLELDYGSPADLKALAAAVVEADPVLRLNKFEATLDVDRSTTFAAVEVLNFN